MFLLIGFALIIYGFSEIQCSAIATNTSTKNVQNVTQEFLTQEYQNPAQRQHTVLVDLQSLDSPQRVTPNFEEPSAVGVTLNRQPKFFGGLAFLAGLGVGGLTSAASTSVNSFAKLTNGAPPVNPGPQGYLGAFYNPYALFTYPYFQPYPGWYPFQDPTKVQHPVTPAGYNQYPQQNFNVESEVEPEEINVVEEEYIEAGKKMEDHQEHTKNPVEEDLVAETWTEDDWDAKKDLLPQTEASVAKDNDSLRKSSNDTIEKQDSQDYFEEGESSSAFSRAVNSTRKEDTSKTTTTTEKPIAVENNNQTTFNDSSMPQTPPNSTVQSNETSNTPFQGYFGGNPKEISHIVLTEERPVRGYQQYDENDFNLPFDRPANFNPYGRYDTYPNAPLNPFLPADRAHEYLNTLDFNHFDYPLDSAPILNGFRPIV